MYFDPQSAGYTDKLKEINRYIQVLLVLPAHHVLTQLMLYFESIEELMTIKYINNIFIYAFKCKIVWFLSSTKNHMTTPTLMSVIIIA